METEYEIIEDMKNGHLRKCKWPFFVIEVSRENAGKSEKDNIYLQLLCACTVYISVPIILDTKAREAIGEKSADKNERNQEGI